MINRAVIFPGVIALAFSGIGGLAWQPQAAVAASRERVVRAVAAGSYAEASRLAAEFCGRVDTELGADSLAAASALDLLVEARLKNGEGWTPETLGLAQRAVRIKEQHLGPDHLGTAISLHNLGNAHAQRGELKAAVRLHEQGLRIRSAALGTESAGVADSLDALALALIRLERFQEARQRLDASLQVRETGAHDSPRALAGTLELMGILLRYSGGYAAAVGPIDRALAIQRQLAPEHSDLVQLSALRGDLAFLMGDAIGAQRIWASALSLGERTLGPTHPVMADVLRRLGFAAFSLGNLAEARQYRERALAVGEATLAPCNPELERLLVGVANSLQLDGDYVGARKLHRRALTTINDCENAGADVTTDDHATTVFNMAALAGEIGDLAEADRLYADAVRIWSKGLGTKHPFVATGLDARAEVAAARGRLTDAKALYEQALVIRRGNLGADHPLVGWTLTSLARVVADRGAVTVALGYVDQAIAIYKKSGGSDDPGHFARVLELRGALERRRGNLGASRESVVAALAERERVFGPAHPLTAATRASLADIDFARGAPAPALAAALDAEQAGRDHLRYTVRYLPERQAMAYASKRPRGLDLALSIAASGSIAEQARLYDAVIQSRGVVLDELAARSRAVYQPDAQFISPRGRVDEARQRFANLVVRSLHEPVGRTLLDDARRQKEEAERDLAERSVDARAELARASIGLEGIRRVLPPNAALISFVRYERAAASVADNAARTPSYAAFVLAPGSADIAFVPLGTAGTLEQAVRAWRTEAAGSAIIAGLSPGEADRRYQAVAARLKRLAWAPVETQLRGAKLVFIVPDGLLNLVNFAAFPGPDGPYMAETDTVIHYLSTERDLLVSNPAGVGQRTLLAVGGASFGTSPPAGAGQSAGPGSGCHELGRTHFEELPGSLSEVQDIGKLWSEWGATDVTMLTAGAASETAVKRALAGRRVIHLATHGFFLGADCTVEMPGVRSVGGLVAASTAKPIPAVVDNPLLLAGLALAGANRRQGAALNQDEGILTAEEIAGLNLQGTEWAVLSACDTGLGEFKAGEGVFGLRRAFQIAGAQTVIMTLWSIEDRSAQSWMRTLYQGRLQSHLSTADAVHEANITVLRERRASGRSTHPFYWAAFVAAGDWR